MCACGRRPIWVHVSDNSDGPSHFSLIMVNRLATELGHTHRGEVVVFWAPDHAHILYVKRMIGMPGDTVTEITYAVYINGHKLNESNPDLDTIAIIFGVCTSTNCRSRAPGEIPP